MVRMSMGTEMGASCTLEVGKLRCSVCEVVLSRQFTMSKASFDILWTQKSLDLVDLCCWCISCISLSLQGPDFT